MSVSRPNVPKQHACRLPKRDYEDTKIAKDARSSFGECTRETGQRMFRAVFVCDETTADYRVLIR